MSAIAFICERWVMHIDPDEQDAGYMNWVLKNPGDASRHLTTLWWAAESLLNTYDQRGIESAAEYFAGTGAQALILRHFFPFIKKHLLMEFSSSSIEHLDREMPLHLGCEIAHNDAFKGQVREADLQVLDTPNLTARQTLPDGRYRRLLDAVFGSRPRAVLVNDLAARRLHLHRERYSEILGVEVTDYRSYLVAMASRYENLYGYHLSRCVQDRWSATFALVRDESPHFRRQFMMTPEYPVGLDLF